MKSRRSLLDRAEKAGYPMIKLSRPWRDTEARVQAAGPQSWILLVLFGESDVLDSLDAQLALLDPIDVEGKVREPERALVVWTGGGDSG